MDKFVIIGLVLFVSLFIIFGYDTETDSFFIDGKGVSKFLCEMPIVLFNQFTESDIEQTEFANFIKERYGCN